jgi:hypothetical protein
VGDGGDGSGALAASKALNAASSHCGRSGAGGLKNQPEILPRYGASRPRRFCVMTDAEPFDSRGVAAMFVARYA